MNKIINDFYKKLKVLEINKIEIKEYKIYLNYKY